MLNPICYYFLLKVKIIANIKYDVNVNEKFFKDKLF